MVSDTAIGLLFLTTVWLWLFHFVAVRLGNADLVKEKSSKQHGSRCGFVRRSGILGVLRNPCWIHIVSRRSSLEKSSSLVLHYFFWKGLYIHGFTLTSLETELAFKESYLTIPAFLYPSLCKQTGEVCHSSLQFAKALPRQPWHVQVDVCLLCPSRVAVELKEFKWKDLTR